ncbi:MAG: glycosyltransferase family 4 protein [Kiritimatiellia bacterium]|nr:glycosyltransferase family 4 protein [Kiritimatiellia bacterium]
MTTPDYSPCITDAERRRPLLFLDKVFLRPRKQTLRGVELFNQSLIRDLAREGIKLTVPVHYSWKDVLSGGLSGVLPDFHEVALRKTLLNGLKSVWQLRRVSYQYIILANVANSLIPALWLLRLFHSRPSLILFAHRMPSLRFLAALSKKKTRVIAVNGIIAARFKKAGFEDANVCFGHIDADKFFPHAGSNGTKRPADREDGKSAAPGPQKVNFCVVGFLNNAWKGADTAVAAFRLMPKDICAKCVLHLASFRAPPSFPEQNIRAYNWLPTGEMPQWLRRMDVMIVPSRDERVMRETFSLTMVEGMLTALPIIATNLPVLAEKLNAGGGYVFNNAAELSRWMTLLATRPQLRAELGGKARLIALERYIWNTKKFVSRYLA